MTWWQVVLVFAGIPAAVFGVVTVVVLRFTTSRVPDGLAHARTGQPGPDRATPTKDTGADEGQPESEDE